MQHSTRLLLSAGLLFAATLIACGDDDAPANDSGPAPQDAGGVDVVTAGDAGAIDVTTIDSSAGCTNDDQCMSGVEWCVGGECVECDNTGLACDIACENGWAPYERNGCYPCACAPPMGCSADGECAIGETCYAGRFCWDWCPAGDPSCCLGNQCSTSGCDSLGSGCFVTGCPEGESCIVEAGQCVPSSCACTADGPVCTEDCGGGSCMQNDA